MSPTPSRELPGLLDPRAMLHRHVEDLATRFAGMVNAETVERTVFESYTALAPSATVSSYLPLLAVRFATDRLTALAQAKGALTKDRPEVLFVCVQNAGRSQMAAALLTRAAAGRVHVRSAGSAPAGEVEPAVAQILTEVGVDLADAFPKPLTDDVIQAADVIVTMGCGDACPLYPGKRYLDWDVPDPAGQPVEVVRAIRDTISSRVHTLLTELTTPPANEHPERPDPRGRS